MKINISANLRTIKSKDRERLNKNVVILFMETLSRDSITVKERYSIQMGVCMKESGSMARELDKVL
jgi:hypothetical protein